MVSGDFFEMCAVRNGRFIHKCTDKCVPVYDDRREMLLELRLKKKKNFLAELFFVRQLQFSTMARAV